MGMANSSTSLGFGTPVSLSISETSVSSGIILISSSLIRRWISA